VRSEQRWFDTFPEKAAARHRRVVPLQNLLADIDAAQQALDFRGGAVSPIEIATVGNSALLGIRELRDFVVRGIERGALTAGYRPQHLYRRARRFPNPARNGSSRPDQLAAIDRADALAEVFSHSTNLLHRALADHAYSLLGHVLRDARVILSISDQLPEFGESPRPFLRAAAFLLLGDWSVDDPFAYAFLDVWRNDTASSDGLRATSAAS
jgi:hypothetical protein